LLTFKLKLLQGENNYPVQFVTSNKFKLISFSMSYTRLNVNKQSSIFSAVRTYYTSRSKFLAVPATQTTFSLLNHRSSLL